MPWKTSAQNTEIFTCFLISSTLTKIRTVKKKMFSLVSIEIVCSTGGKSSTLTYIYALLLYTSILTLFRLLICASVSQSICLVSVKIRRGQWSLSHWSYGYLWSTMWILRVEFLASISAASAPNCWVFHDPHISF